MLLSKIFKINMNEYQFFIERFRSFDTDFAIFDNYRVVHQ
jgi:hypothetical protein